MRSFWIDLWIRLRASYWFVPTLMAMAAGTLALVMVNVDAAVGDEWIGELDWLYANQPDGARALLSTVAGSMITVAGVTFSITLVMVSHASAQIGPRLLSGFMRDTGNQVTLGTFVATFIYCLLVLRTVQSAGQDGPPFVPHLSILIGLGLALGSVGVLIYFIDHVPQSLNVANRVALVGKQLVHEIEEIYPENIGEAAANAPDLPAPEDGRIVRLSSEGGYLRVLDQSSLMEIASNNDLLLEIMMRPGEFGSPHSALVRVWPGDHVNAGIEREICAAFSWGAERTPEQDVLFLVDQINEVAGRALSPGINDQFSAVACMDQHERALIVLSERALPSPHRADAEGKLRIVAEPIGYELFIDRMLEPLRQHVVGDGIATLHLLGVVDRALRAIANARVCERLRAHVALIAADADESLPVSSQKAAVRAASAAILERAAASASRSSPFAWERLQPRS